MTYQLDYQVRTDLILSDPGAEAIKAVIAES
jgi:hypothetical protein